MNSEYENYNAHMSWAFKVALSSPDLSTQNGAIIAHEHRSQLVQYSTGYNMPLLWMDNLERLQRPAKYKWTEHAERAAIYDAANHGRSTHGATMIAIWAACSDCARAIVWSGIRTLVRCSLEAYAQWNEEVELGDTIMKEAGVQIIEYDFPNISVEPILHNGKLWRP